MNCKKILPLLFCVLFLVSCNSRRTGEFISAGTAFYAGFGEKEIEIPETDGALYIAGYHNGWEIEGLLDKQKAKALWLDTGGEGMLLISIDCVGLGSDTVERIRDSLKDFCKRNNCKSITVVSTHDHAGIDTLGLWGPVAQDGKNEDFTNNLIGAASEAAEQAYAARRKGNLYYSEIETQGMQHDSRSPETFDTALYRLRFVPEDASAGIMLVDYAAHAEALRGDNKLVSSDWPGSMAKKIKEESGYDTLFVQGAIGGLIMTEVQTEGGFDAVKNMEVTGEKLAACALSEAEETAIKPVIRIAEKSIDIPLDNTLYMYYRFLGILNNPMRRGKSETGYVLKSQVGVLEIGDIVFALIPGEIFPEMFEQIKEQTGKKMIPVCLANDEIGYIVNPDDFILDAELPYIDSVKGHYEETNSCGKGTFEIISKALEELLR